MASGLVLPSTVIVPATIEGGAETEYEEVGDRGRTFNGTGYSNVRATKANKTFRTAAVTSTLAASIKSALNSSVQPLACWGDLIGVSSSTTANYFGQLLSEEYSQATSARLTTLSFKLNAE